MPGALEVSSRDLPDVACIRGDFVEARGPFSEAPERAISNRPDVERSIRWHRVPSGPDCG